MDSRQRTYVLIPTQGIRWYAMFLRMLAEVFHELGKNRLEFLQCCGHLGERLEGSVDTIKRQGFQIPAQVGIRSVVLVI